MMVLLLLFIFLSWESWSLENFSNFIKVLLLERDEVRIYFIFVCFIRLSVFGNRLLKIKEIGWCNWFKREKGIF